MSARNGGGMIERLIARLIIAFIRLLTGAQAFWRGIRPNAAQRIYFANHASHGDFVLLWASLPPWLRRRTRPVAGADYWNRDPLRRFLGGKVFRAVLIDRERKAAPDKSDRPDPIEQMVDALTGGDSLIIFPEGTRNTTDAVLLPFKSGLFHLATKAPQAELVPVWINNLARVMPKGQLLPIPLLCTVVFGPPLARIDGEDKAAFLERARAAMLALRPEDPDDATPSDNDDAIPPAPVEPA
ncbi:lysophospholipid acyltransferase family protein [Lysobacter hankyongensis]|uniref:Lysophospholipid acyltransferase family protein n=2 Tax=Lysobacter hankyongensis TaxID=1176535 RepID=A0ABP9AZN4_9GAMM